MPRDVGTRASPTTGLWVCDCARYRRRLRRGHRLRRSAPIPAVLVGTALLLVASSSIAASLVARRPDRLDACSSGWRCSPSRSSCVPTRVHERYGYPFFAMGAILAAISWRWRIAYVVLSVATFAEHVRRPDHALPGQPVGSRTGWGSDRRIRLGAGRDDLSLVHPAAFLAGRSCSCARARGDSRTSSPRARAPCRGRRLERRWHWAAADGDRAGRARGRRGELACSRDRPRAAPAGGGRSRRVAVGRGRARPSGPPRAAAVGRRRAADADLDAARRPSSELGIVGWFRARLSDPPVRAGPERHRSVARAAAASTGSTCGSSSCSSSRR